jgi:molybdopterin synthase catalytic subunit
VRRLSKRRINVAEVLERVADGGAGGTVVFVGTVRDHHRGKKVVGLEYEAYAPMAEAKLEEIELESRRRWPVRQMSIVHRTGRLRVGDVSVVVAVSAEHRAEAFEASRFAIESLKRTVPIWKREVTPDGKTEWVEGERIERLEVAPVMKGREEGSRRRRPRA